MSNYDKEVVDQLKKINEQLEIIKVTQMLMLDAFSVMNMANADGETRAKWSVLQESARELIKKAGIKLG